MPIRSILVPTMEEINGLEKDARQWKIIAIVLFFIGIGVDRLLSILLLS